MVVTFFSRIFVVGNRDTKCLVSTCCHAGFIYSIVHHMAVFTWSKHIGEMMGKWKPFKLQITKVVKFTPEAIERLSIASVVREQKVTWVTGTFFMGHLNSSFYKAVWHFIPKWGMWHVTWHCPNVTLQCIGISPSSQKMGLWDQSQCHVQSIVGIDPNVMKKRVLGSVPMSCTVQAVIGIDPTVMKNKTLGSVPKS